MDLLTLRDVACRLRISRSHVGRMRNGRLTGLPPLPVVRLGRRVLIRRDALEAWLTNLERRELEASYASGCFARSIDADPVYQRN